MHWRIGILTLVWLAGRADLSPAQGWGRARPSPNSQRENPLPTRSITRSAFTRPAGATSTPTLLRVPAQYPTIQSAIDAASDGDTVLVSEGTYYENIRYRGKAITVGSLYLTDGDTAHIEKTIIDGSRSTNPDSGSVVYFTYGEDTTSVLCGLTITGGTGTMHFFDFPYANGSVWYRMGGGVFCDGAGARIFRNVISGNRCFAALVHGGGIQAISLQPTTYVIVEQNRITNNSIRGDSATADWHNRGGGASVRVSARIVGNLFEGNSVTGYLVTGGGLTFAQLSVGAYGPLPSGTIRGNVFRNDTVVASDGGARGGGLYVGATGEVTIADNAFTGNVASSQTSMAIGGGIALQDTGITGYGRRLLVQNRILNNRAVSGSHYGGGGGINLWTTAATLRGNYFVENISTGGGDANGGGLVALLSSFRMDGNIFVRNSTSSTAAGTNAGGGGAMFLVPGVAGSEQLIANNIFSGNRGTGPGGAIGMWDNSSGTVPLTIVNNTFTGNSAREGGGVAFWNDVYVIFMNNILWGNRNGSGWDQISNLSSIGFYYGNDIMGGWSRGSNINVPPSFADTTYRLSDSSFCIGAGIDSMIINGTWYRAPSQDIYGTPRPSPPGSHSDIGACENLLPISLNAAALSVTPQIYDFHNVSPGTVSDTLSVIVANRDAVPWQILSLSPLKPEFVFSPAPGLPLTIAPHSQVQLRLTFKPVTPGVTLRDTLRITTNDRYYATKSVTLTGRGSAVVQCAQPGVLYGISASSTVVSLYEIDRSTGSVRFNSRFTPRPPSGMSALTQRAADNAMYGAFSSDTTTALYRMSSADGDLEPFGRIPLGRVTSMAFSPLDVLYLVTSAGKMYRVHSPWSDTVFVGWTGHTFTGLAFSPATRVLWASAEDSIFTADTTGGSATLVGSSGYSGPGSLIAFGGLGTLYGIFAGWLVTVDRVWGTATEIGHPGIPSLIGIAMSDRVVDVSEEGGEEQVRDWRLEQNHPNPFNPATTIRFDLPERTHVRLSVYDLLGREVALLVNEGKAAGSHSVQFDGSGLASGVYICRLQAGMHVQSRKMALLK